MREEKVIFHALDRGARRGVVAQDHLDRENMVRILKAALKRFDFDLLAFCVLLTHYHILIRACPSLLPEIMKFINFNLTIGFNDRHGGTGHLLEGPYRAIPKRTPEEILFALFYVHANGSVELRHGQGLEDHPYCTHGDYCGVSRFPFVDLGLLRQFDPDPVVARRRYLGYVREHLPDYLEAARRKAKRPDRKRHQAQWGEERMIELGTRIQGLLRTFPRVEADGVAPLLRQFSAPVLALYCAYRAGFGSIRRLSAVLGWSSSTGHRKVQAVAGHPKVDEAAGFFDRWVSRCMLGGTT